MALPASAAMTTIETKNIIIGTAPYLTFDGGETKATDTAALFSIKLSDGRVFSQDNNQSTPDNPIELPVEDQTLADVQMFVPIDKQIVNLSELIITSNNYWRDDDGDGEEKDTITATGSLTLQIQDSTGKTLNRTDNISLCDGATYYKVVLTSTAGTLKTQYGSPNSTNFAASNVTYYIKPKPTTKPYACWAQPNMQYSGSQPDGPSIEYYNWDGPVTQWDKYKGFKLQNINTPSSNFPTMGAYGLFFKLTIAGDVWQNVSYDKTPADSGIDIIIDNGGSTNIAKIQLNGPRYNTNNANTVVPTTFTIYSDKEKTNKIYSFNINRWFIATPGAGNGFKANYCVNRYGSKYRIPSVTEFTNANNKYYNWTGGLSGQPKNYQRRIGGGLFAEWGNMYSGNYYTSADYDNNYYWAFESYSSSIQRNVNSSNGYVGGIITNLKDYLFACVTP
ncbi:hypothetical protein PT276_09470 [Orbaceae bacterium ESL0721]|nr:hypothetical protein [Orbaceae bacterium ESL0721]